MERVAVVGCSGSGKTTLARDLAARLGCPHVELDAIFHQPNWADLDVDEFRRRTRQAAAGDRWVIDGTYSVVQPIVWGRADTIVWFDLPLFVVMARVVRRTLRRAVLRTELWNGNREPWSNLYRLDPQKSIIAWAATRHGVYRRRYEVAESDPQWSALEFVRLRSARDVRSLLASVPTVTPQGGAI